VFRTSVMFVLAALTLAGIDQRPAAPAAQPSPGQRFWPQWRGPHASGISRTAQPPLEWSESKNIRWKIEIPGRGAATPVIWGDLVYVPLAEACGARSASS
jgi:hypothetical protein